MDWLSIKTYVGATLNSIIAAVVILLLGFILGKLVGRLLHKVLHEAELDNILKKAGARLPLETVLANLAEYFIYFVAVIFALNQLGITTVVLYIIALAAMVILIISAFLGLKDFIPNFIAGIVIYRKELITKGDRVSIDGVSGKVDELSLLDTKIKTSKGDIIYIPNSIVIKSKVVKKK
ncbi:MAG: mechanosensitive ion channel [Candidatus Woesearchaeota archaeon]